MLEALITVELQLRSDLLFSFGHAQRVGNQLHGLPCACFRTCLVSSKPSRPVIE